ncbi:MULTISPECIES: hypothetical protein [Halorussus]|uniref:hypothetical protein n=1 Tax=Halorussus TaxID=1070314 RepID=UPI00209E0838|nr:hypothetical protein [Halorussus vallis]USZ76120.1 hypothetical protein NGM07_02055 [Halorussus vallis]
MTEKPTPEAEPTNETASHPDQDWGRIAFYVVLSIIVTLGLHYVAFAGMNLSPTAHAFVGMVLFFVVGFVSFGVFY